MAEGLTLRLNADASGLQSGLSDGGKAMDGMGDDAERAAKRQKALAAALAAVVAGVAVLIKAAINYGDKIGKLAEKTGIAVEALSSFKLLAELGGTSLDGMAKGLKKLAKGMNDAVTIGTGPASDAFKALGITVTDTSGKLKGTDAILSEIADSFAGMENGAQKAALAQDLLGRAGVDLIPVLNQGSAAMADMRQESEDLGLVWSDEASQAAEDFNDSISRLKASADGFFQTAAQFYVPVLADWAGNTAELVRWMLRLGRAQSDEKDNINELIQAQSNAVIIEKERRQNVIEAIAGREALGQSTDDHQARLVELNATIERESLILKNLRIELGAEIGLRKQTARSIEDVTTATDDEGKAIDLNAARRRKAAAEKRENAQAAKEEAAAARERAGAEAQVLSIVERLAAREDRAILARLSGSARVREASRQEVEEVLRASRKTLENEVITAQGRKAIHEATRQALATIRRDEAAQLLQIRINGLDAEKQANKEASDKMSDDAADAAATRLALWNSLGGSISNIFGGIGQLVSNISRQMTRDQKKAAREQFIATKVAGIAQATIGTALAVINGLQTVPLIPLGVAAAIGAGIAGGIQIAVIASEPMPAGLGDAGIMPGALRQAGLNNHSLFIKDDQEVLVDKKGTRELTEMLALDKQAKRQRIDRSQPIRIVNDKPIILNDREVGRFVDDHLIQQEEMGRDRGQRTRGRRAS